MASPPTDISGALQSIPEKKEFLRKTFEDLEEQRAIISRCSRGWKDLDARLSEIHDALEKRYKEIVDKEMKFEARMKELQETLDKRESVIESREQASLARVQEQKDAAIAAIREQKRKWIEERQLLQNQSLAKPDVDATGCRSKHEDGKVGQKDDTNKADTHGKERADINSKKRDTGLKDRPDLDDQKRSKALTSSKNSNKEDANTKSVKAKDNDTKKNEEVPKPASTTVSQDCSASGPMEVDKQTENEVPTNKKQEILVGKQHAEQQNDSNSKEKAEPMTTECQDSTRSGDEDGSDDAKDEDGNDEIHKEDNKEVESKLRTLCENMDGIGLHSFMNSQKKKDIKLVKKELTAAMRCASDPPKLVLESILNRHSTGSTTENGKDKPSLSALRSCVTLLESLGAILDDEGRVKDGFSDGIKEEASKIAEAWKTKLNPKGTDLSALLEMQRFLQLVAVFGLSTSFNEAELCDLVACTCARKPVRKLLHKLGLDHKVSGLIERVIKDGKNLEAVDLIQEYKLAEKFPPVPLLKAYLKDIRQGHTTSASAEEKDEIHMKELNAARAVLKCVETYKLEADYPTEGLQRRIAQLEKLSTEKRRNPDTSAGVSKKPRVNVPNVPQSNPYRPGRFGGRGTGGRNFGVPYGQAGYPYIGGGPIYGSSYARGNFNYGGRLSYQGPYRR
ncbi:hypothetical protein KP509_12G040400 [Ceratopteris richardii]|uniref:FRIGIDA-like protein n=1 Tax=Ceratopteris richardii TaxID=49495 RepID=A0A8T2TKX5_CERRI|nr:hypothetical protein KP509_12G040400 [Ceratopteris richardii]